MRACLLLTIAISPCVALAAPKKIKPAVPAVPAKPAEATGAAKPGGTLIDSDLGGRDLTFLTSAIEEGKILRLLSDQTARTSNPDLRGFGDDLVKTLAAQSAVLNTVAEMRKIAIPAGESENERRIAAKLANLEGAKLEKVLLDEFRAVDRRAVATYELGLTSMDQTIHKLCEQTLPKLREHLVVVDAMAGIAPKRPPGETVLDPAKPVPVADTPIPIPEPPLIAAPPRRPGFRTNVQLPGEGSPAAGR
jgi:hypothetical protein